MTYATWLPDVLRAAGINVVTHPGWATRSSLGKRNPGPAGPLTTDRPALLWHHDASPAGDSPGALDWMRSQLDIPGASSANIWVDRYGTWHIIAAGTTWHAGTVSDARWSNFNSIGIETDHTTGEDWPPALLSSLRRGSAAILNHVGRTPADALNFHKHVAIPRGSKVDPDGLDLPTERAHLAALLNPTTEDTMPGTVTSDYISEQVKALGDQVQEVANATVDVPYIKAQLKTLGDQIQLVANAQVLDRQALIGAVEAAARAQGGTVDPSALARDVADRLDVKVTPKVEDQK